RAGAAAAGFPAPEEPADDQEGRGEAGEAEAGGADEGREEAGDDGVEDEAGEGLQGGCGTALGGEHVQDRQGDDGEHEGDAEGVEDQRQDGPGDGGVVGEQVIADVGGDGDGAAGEAGVGQGDAADAPGGAARDPGAGHHAADHGDEEPAELAFAQAQDVHDESGGGGDEEEQGGEVEGAGGGQALEAGVGEDVGVVAGKAARRQRAARFLGQALGQPAPGGQQQGQGEQHQEPEDGRPARPAEDPAADDGGDGRGDAEDHRDLGEQALGVVAVVQVADHGAPHHHADAGRQALGGAKGQQGAKVARHGAADRSQGEHDQPAEDDPAPAEGVR